MSEQIPLNISTTHIFKDHIERVWKIFLNIHTFKKIFCDEMDNFEYKNGDIFLQGSELRFRWKNMLYIFMKIEEIIDNPNYKKIKFSCYKVYPIEMKFRVIFHFYWNTVDEITLYIHEVNCEETESILIYNFQNNEEERKLLCKRVEKMLYEDFQNLDQTESILIKISLNKIWSVITNWNIFKLFVPNIAEEVEYIGDGKDVGTEMKIINKSKNSLNQLRVVKSTYPFCDSIIEDLSCKKAEYTLYCYYGSPRCPLQNLICKNFFISFIKKFINSIF